VGAVEKALGVGVILGRPAVADLVEVDGELGGVEGAVLAQVLAQLDDVVLGFQLGHGAPPNRDSAVENSARVYGEWLSR
jgi:hypothetical protein